MIDIVKRLREGRTDGTGLRWMVTDEHREAADEIERLRKALSSAAGYLLNAKIDLETGAPKRTAINTIEGGLCLVEAALKASTSTSDNGSGAQ